MMKVSEIIRLIEQDGWRLVSQEGSHRQYKHRPRRAGSQSPDTRTLNVPVGTLKNIFRQAQMKETKR
jgi:predicted RNA binding protein YcfA (HicA-like mRNA interferase family)